jgi:predicted transcriptional regulator of viral defense system
MPRAVNIDILDELASRGRTTVSTTELREMLGRSPQATSNLASRWVKEGFVDRVAPGRYALRGLGNLGTRAASEDVALAVGALLAAEPHRIAFKTALDYHGLIVHPVRRIQVATDRRVQVSRLSGRLLQVIREPAKTIRIGAEQVTAGAWVSGHERALLDAATRLDLVDGVAVLAEALQARPANAAGLQKLALQLDATAGLRRLGSLADVLHVPGLAGVLERPARGGSIWLDPYHERVAVWRDRRWGVDWNRPPDEIVAITRT